MSPVALELVQVAQSYCELIENSNNHDDGWLAQVASLLPRLHVAIESLEDGNGRYRHVLAGDLDARFELYTHLRGLLGNRDGYWMEFDVAGDGQVMSGSLADDLTDIYYELKHGLIVMEGAPGSALEEWRQGFRMHWGQHLLDAERHLYELRVRGELG
jgi:hypothetical protein